MNHVWKIALLIVLVIIGFYIVRELVSMDDTPSTTIEDHRVVLADWQATDSIAQNIICNMWLDAKNDGMALRDLFAEDYDAGRLQAKMALLERECVEHV